MTDAGEVRMPTETAEIVDHPFWMTDREILHDEAKLIAQRLINSHFGNDDRAHVSIPANPDRDDDLLILAYIEQQRRRDVR